MESERKSKIITAGLDAVKHNGKWCGNLPFWLQKIDEKGNKKEGRTDTRLP